MATTCVRVRSGNVQLRRQLLCTICTVHLCSTCVRVGQSLVPSCCRLSGACPSSTAAHVWPSRSTAQDDVAAAATSCDSHALGVVEDRALVAVVSCSVHTPTPHSRDSPTPLSRG